MVQIFHVEKGVTYHLPMSHTVENIAHLKTAIESKHGIDSKFQVLLISGGEALENDKKVGTYHAGTDTNPIFLFSTTNIDPTTSGSIASGSGSSGSADSRLDSSSASDDINIRMLPLNQLLEFR